MADKYVDRYVEPVRQELVKLDLNAAISNNADMLARATEEEALLRRDAQTAVRAGELEYAQWRFDLNVCRQVRIAVYVALGVSALGFAFLATRADMLVERYNVIAVAGAAAVISLIVYLIQVAGTGQRQANNWNKTYFPGP